MAHFSQLKRSGGDQGRSESPFLGSEASDDSKPSTKGKGKGKAAKKGKSDSYMPLHFASVLIVWTPDDGDFSIHRKRVGQPFSVTLRSDPDPHPAAWITSSYSEEAKEGKNHWWVHKSFVLIVVSYTFPLSGSPLKNITDMPPPASKKSSKLRENSITRESSNAPSMDNESRMSFFSPEATPFSPTSSTDSPSAASVKVTNGKNTQKSGAAHNIPATSVGPSQSSAHDPSYMMMGKQIIWRTPAQPN